jgi:WD40 repeat protein
MRLILLLLTIPLLAVGQVPELAFTIKEKDFIPEGLAYNAADASFYVGSIHKNKIVRISAKGEVSDFVHSRQDSIGQVLGLHIDTDKQELWACSNEAESLKGGRASVHRYDLKTGKLIKKYTYQVKDEIHLFNDLVLLNGKVYVSDSDFGSIFVIDPVQEKPALFLQSDKLYYVNGITTLPNNKLLLSAGNGFRLVDIETKVLTLLSFEKYYIIGIDGLYYKDNSLIGIQNVTYPACINRYYLNADYSSISKATVLLADHKSFNVPNTGALAGEHFYFIANSHLNHYDKGKITNEAALDYVQVMRIKLKD